MKPESKDTVLFVHGAWHGKWCWEEYFVKYFSDRGYNTVVFDLPGHDTPGKVKGINRYSIRNYVAALRREVEKLSTPPIIIAHSMGGLILQKFLETGICKKAIYLASVPPYGVIKTIFRFSVRPYFFPSLLTLDLYKLVNSNNKARWAFFNTEMPDEKVSAYTARLCSESYRAILEMLIPGIRIKHHLQIPTLVIGAGDDNLFSIKDCQITADRYHADLKIMNGVAHDMMLDTNHENVSEQILSWIEK